MSKHVINDLIKYKNIYYIIKEITIISRNKTMYILDFVNKHLNNSRKTQIILESKDKNIISINKKEQTRIIRYLKFLDIYNSSINYLNKKTCKKFTLLKYENADEDINKIFTIFKLKINILYQIKHIMSTTQDLSIQITNIEINPFDFITQDFQLLTYENAERISKIFSLNIKFEINLEKWTYDFFLRENKTFYLTKYEYVNKIKKFCLDREKKYKTFETFIKNILIEKNINGIIWVTTDYLLNFEKRMTDMTITLFYEKIYSIPDDIIVETINMYEKLQQHNTGNSLFMLASQQKESVMNSIKNKLSIITGPPGTGKTEILKCINFVLYHLYKNNEEINNDNKYIHPNDISLMAPTGLAYINMTNEQDIKHYNKNISGTCHKILYSTIQKNDEEELEEEEQEANNQKNFNLIEIDESSMLDNFMFKKILDTCENFNSRLILLGDIEQLSAIGPGDILGNLINCELFSVTKLTQIQRQKDKTGRLVSNILKMSKEIVQITDFDNEYMIFHDIDDYIIDNQLNKNNIINLIINNDLNKKNTKFITIFAKEDKIFNTGSINNLIQTIFNPEIMGFDCNIIPSNFKYENSFIFKVNDKIIRIHNDYSTKKMRANGEEAEILSLSEQGVTIQYSCDKPEIVTIDELYEDFKLNYCGTVYKSQGSQYENVIFFIDKKSYYADKKSIYTAISRAKNKCFVISTEFNFINIQKKINPKISLFMKESNDYELEY
jgi:exodeoxyribonuclease V alpha subunit